MTEQEFMRQVWRPYDSVEVDGGMKGRVTSVCFPTRSVKVSINKEVHEWFKCEMIVAHSSAAGQTDDVAIIEDLHNKLMASNERNNNLQSIVNIQNEKIAKLQEAANEVPEDKNLKKIKKSINTITNTLDGVNARFDNIRKLLSEMGINADFNGEES